MNSCQLLTILLAAFCCQQVSSQGAANGNVFESAFQFFKSIKSDTGNFNIKNLPDSIQQTLKQFGLDFNKTLNCEGIVVICIKFIFRPEYKDLIKEIQSQVQANQNITAIIRNSISRAIEVLANVPFIGNILQGFLKLSPNDILEKIIAVFDLMGLESIQKTASGIICNVFKGGASDFTGLFGLFQ